MIYDEDPFRRSRRNRQQVKTTGGVCLNGGKPVQMGLPAQENREIRSSGGGGNYPVPSTVARLYDFREPGGYLGNVGSVQELYGKCRPKRKTRHAVERQIRPRHCLGHL